MTPEVVVRLALYEKALKEIGSLILRYEAPGDFPDGEAEEVLDRIDTIVLDTLAATPKAERDT